MLQQEVHYEICTEDHQGFLPQFSSNASLAEAEKELSEYRKRWPHDGAFIVRVPMTRVSKRNGPLRLKAV